MFRNTSTAAVAEPAPIVAPSADLIPLSVLALDLSAPADWSPFLTVRGVEVLVDDVGRKAVSRDDARTLIAEKRENERRAREMAAQNEQRMIEADQRWRAGLNKGVEWWRLPDNTAPGDAMALAAAQANRQEELLEQEFGGSQNSMVYRPYPQAEDES